MTEVDRFIRLKELMNIVALGRSTIYARIEQGAFPAQIDLGGGVVAWRESEIRAWMDACPKKIAA